MCSISFARIGIQYEWILFSLCCVFFFTQKLDYVKRERKNKHRKKKQIMPHTRTSMRKICVSRVPTTARARWYHNVYTSSNDVCQIIERLCVSKYCETFYRFTAALFSPHCCCSSTSILSTSCSSSSSFSFLYLPDCTRILLLPHLFCVSVVVRSLIQLLLPQYSHVCDSFVVALTLAHTLACSCEYDLVWHV